MVGETATPLARLEVGEDKDKHYEGSQQPGAGTHSLQRGTVSDKRRLNTDYQRTLNDSGEHPEYLE